MLFHKVIKTRLLMVFTAEKRVCVCVWCLMYDKVQLYYNTLAARRKWKIIYSARFSGDRDTIREYDSESNQEKVDLSTGRCGTRVWNKIIIIYRSRWRLVIIRAPQRPCTTCTHLYNITRIKIPGAYARSLLFTRAHVHIPDTCIVN